jgi:hypothetical protein
LPVEQRDDRVTQYRHWLRSALVYRAGVLNNDPGHLAGGSKELYLLALHQGGVLPSRL